jgi:hypothetical protein
MQKKNVHRGNMICHGIWMETVQASVFVFVTCSCQMDIMCLISSICSASIYIWKSLHSSNGSRPPRSAPSSAQKNLIGTTTETYGIVIIIISTNSTNSIQLLSLSRYHHLLCCVISYFLYPFFSKKVEISMLRMVIKFNLFAQSRRYLDLEPHRNRLSGQKRSFSCILMEILFIVFKCVL